MEINEARAVVTGAASGLGRCFALELLRRGASVAAGDINENGLLSLEKECSQQGLPGKLAIASLDVTREPSVQEFFREMEGRLGVINTLVNNAGILRDGLLVARENGWVKRLPTRQWQAVIDTNLTGPFFLAREAAARMLETGTRPGLMVNITSISRSGNPGQSNYAAAKAGLDADTRTWALELASHGIRVAGIAPGVIDTPILESITEDQRQHLLKKIPAGRLGQPLEIWLALEFVIRCDFFTGRVIEIDGGDTF